MEDEIEHSVDGCSPDNYVALENTQRIIVIIAHYCAFVTCTFALWAFTRRFEVLKTRIWSPFLLMTGFVWLQLAAAFEISNHFYVNQWQLYEPISDLINGSFSFLNFGAQDLNALSLRKKGTPLCRPMDNLCSKDGILNLIAMLGDFLFIVLIPLRPIVYATLGREASVTILSPLGAFAGIFTLFRLWFNLGPNAYTKWGGIFFFVFAMLGVGMNALYQGTCIEFVHLGIGGAFITSVIPFGIAILNVEYESLPPADVEEENVPNEKPTIASGGDIALTPSTPSLPAEMSA